ncbi:MAG: hypothetical protein FJ280_18140 [Planctomycetes bacterium]|nr:hypothetical protein [Planctomycetota bacterium]
MRRSLCLVGIAVWVLCGCAKEGAPRETETAEVPAVVDPAPESNEPGPPVKAEHPVLAATREFLRAVIAGRYDRALSLSVFGEITQQGLAGMREAFQLDQVTFTQAWLDAEQSAVITNFIPAKQGTATAAWAFNLVVNEDGRWLVRLSDILFNQQMVDAYLAAFQDVAPNAQPIDL